MESEVAEHRAKKAMGQQAQTKLGTGARVTKLVAEPTKAAQERLPLREAPSKNERLSLTVRNPRIIQLTPAMKRTPVAPVVIDLDSELPRKRLRQETSHFSVINPGFGRTIQEIARLLFIPAAAVISLGAVTLYLSGESFEPKSTQAQIAQITVPQLTQLADSSETTPQPENEVKPVSATFFDDIASRLSALSDSPAPKSADIEDLKSKVKFISGLIAMHRPSIHDCGEVAKVIVETSVREKVDPFFLAAVISIESRFANDARSSVGARGLMQLMPATARSLKKSRNDAAFLAQLNDTRTNIDLGVQYLQSLQTKYRGDKTLALSAYNWGPGNVDRARKDGKRIPSSVLKYASTILSRSKNWSNHFQKAKASALELDGVYTAS